MRKYEVTYIIQPTLGEDAVPALVEKFSQQVANNGGQVVNVNTWGRRRLAYEIAGQQEGYYVTMRFDAPDTVAAELRRQLRLSDDILRALVVRVN